MLAFLFTTPHGLSEKEVIYGRRDGLALTMTVITPGKPNGKAIVSLISSGWYSDAAWYGQYRDRAMPFTDSGYTVFLIQHSSAPRYAIPDAAADVLKAVQYVRFNAKEYNIDADHIGITGTSSGGHLALLAAVADDIRNLDSKNLQDRVSSKVQAAAVFCPPTDFLHYGKPDNNIRQNEKLLKDLQVEGSFAYTKYDEATNKFEFMDETGRTKTDSLMSPAELITPDDAPIFISHGDKDDIVPLQQAELMMSRLKSAKIPAKLSIKKEAGHGWKNMNEDEKEFVSWFDSHLKVKQ